MMLVTSVSGIPESPSCEKWVQKPLPKCKTYSMHEKSTFQFHTTEVTGMNLSSVTIDFLGLPQLVQTSRFHKTYFTIR